VVMGACASNMNEEERAARDKSKRINQELRKAGKNPSVKLLLLGTGESGKSTIVKQMKIIHGSGEQTGLTEEDRKAQVVVIRGNVLDSIEVLLDAVKDFGFELGSVAQEAADRVREVLEEAGEGRHAVYSEEVANHVETVWTDPAIQQCLHRQTEFTLLDSAPYFLKKAASLAAPDYLPSDEDVLRARSITTGVVTVNFMLKEKGRELKLELVDVGGQRGERRRWIHCFEGVTAVMFIISLSDYNQTLYEDETTNRMQESQKLFGEMLNNVFFRETPFIVFFNKLDMFREKLKVAPLTLAYKDYTGPQEEEPALAFIRGQFFAQDKSEMEKTKESERIYPFYTTATDTDLVKNIFNTVTDIIITINLKNAGLK